MTKTEITNIALGLIGARRINNFDTDHTVEARAARAHFDPTLGGLLRRHHWNFATKRIPYTQEDDAIPDTSTSEYPLAYPIPSDFVRLLRLATSDPHNPVRHFSIEGHTLYTRATAFDLVYITTDCLDQLDHSFTEALTHALASKIIGDIAQTPEARRELMAQLEQIKMPLATNADARETHSAENFGPSHLAAMSPLVNARYATRNTSIHRPSLP